MTTGIGPYERPVAIDEDPASPFFVTTIVASETTVDIGNGIMANAETYNGAIPGPTFFLNVGDTVVVRLINQLQHPTGIHWHGIELANSADGTEVVQNGVAPRFGGVTTPPAPAGGTYLYKFKVPRPGLYWYHPHHHHSTNRVFKGLYGMIVVADPNEANLIASGIIPGAVDTRQLVLSDITVCKAPGSNDSATYDATLPWVGGVSLPVQPDPTPIDLCEIAPTGSATTDHGDPALVSYSSGDIPSIIRTGRTNEGQTVITNGMNVGGRVGSPLSPGVLQAGAHKLNVLAGQGIRLQVVNCATIRYIRLILTTSAGVQVPLVRIGGEGGLLDNAIVEGGVIGGFDTKYTSGEVLLPPATRADIVAAIPAGTTGVLTLWTQDFQRVGGATNYSDIPTVPMMHLNVMGTAPSTYTIGPGTPLRASIMGQAIETLGSPNAVVLDPVSFSIPKPGMSNQEIQITTPPGINGVQGSFEGVTPYSSVPHIASSRFSQEGRILQLTVKNTTNAHHPFHLHGFSFQPLSITRTGSTFTWPYREFRDNLDVPSNSTLTFRVRLDDRELLDGITMGGGFGRWLFHCHIFFHHHQGMISELVVSAPNGREKPNVDVDGSWAYAPSGGIATRHGTFSHPDGLAVNLTSSLGNVIVGAGNWSWTSPAGLPDQVTYVYITATDPDGRKDQAAFRLKIGAPDDGADNGDPHIHTVDGGRYDFQAAGEFILLLDHEGMEVQARQTPVKAANPITDPYSGLRSCVSVNTAIAARVGEHRISYQPGLDGSKLLLFVDGKQVDTPRNGLNLGNHRVTTYEVSGGGVAVRVDYAHHAVLTVTPYFWDSYGIWILNVSLARTQGNEGLMGSIPTSSWLPRMPNGNNLGPMPADMPDRYIALYHTFANAWRVTDSTSLFTYSPGTSTETFTDREWPSEEPPCKLKPQFEPPEGTPTMKGMKIEEAKKVCRAIKIENFHKDCVFDLATTGDKIFALGSKLAQNLHQRGTGVQIFANSERTRINESFIVTCVVSPFHTNGSLPKGKIVLFIDDMKTDYIAQIDNQGSANFKVHGLEVGNHLIRGVYEGQESKGTNGNIYYPSNSPNIFHLVGTDKREDYDVHQSMGHKLHITDPTGQEQTEVTLDSKTARRMLAWINAANKPEDLLSPPDVLTDFHIEYRKRGYPDKHPPVHDMDEKHGINEEEHPKHSEKDIHELEIAAEVLKHRNESPIYGFLYFADVLNIDFLRDRLVKWWYHFSRASKGEWTGPYNIPGGAFDRPVNAAMLHTGKVLFWGLPTGKNSWLWTPDEASIGTIQSTANSPGDSLFCSGQSFLSDGRLLVVGGGGDGTGPRHNHGWIFDPTPGNEAWRRTIGNGTPGNGDMSYFRWYPTLVTMGDQPGRVLVISGDDTSGNDVQQMEMYMETSDRFELVWGAGGTGDTSANHSFPQIYPGMNLLPGGEVFYTPTGWQSGGCSGAVDFPGAKPSGYFEFHSTSPPVTASWATIDTQDAAAENAIARVKGMAVMLLQPTYPFVQVMVVGGGKDPESSTTFQMINLSTISPKWGPPVALPDGLARVNVNLVALPNGTVFVSGGRPVGGTPPNGGACWIYDPVAMTWRECDAIANRRAYHSVAILLPDGRVATAGNECPADTTYEIFSPPYLFAWNGSLASRPEITGLPTIVHLGQEFLIQTPSSSNIRKVVLVRPMAVTHQTDTEQRVIQLIFHPNGPNELSATAPNGWYPHALAPRGWYMLFLINNNGVPSVARFMHLH